MSRHGWRDKKHRGSMAAPRRAMEEQVTSAGNGTTRAKRLPRSLRVTLGTGLVVLAVVAALAIPDVWQRVGAALVSRTQTTGAVVLDESFDGATLNTSIWNTCHWWADHGCTIATNDELEWYLPEQVSVSDGALRLTADRDPTRGSDGREYEYRSGMVTTGPISSDSEAKVSWTYGTVEARLRVPAGRGLWPALWMLPASGESRPEIDIMEVFGQDPGLNIMHFHASDRREESPSKRFRLPGKSLSE
ncbi:MAG TPA: glycoside hydrolase family 16 protein, partial [Propionibacteriaceae bacterium]|nr:glycoside hydrolase family 16 protein [Propionibacteriaceae bacterium]